MNSKQFRELSDPAPEEKVFSVDLGNPAILFPREQMSFIGAEMCIAEEDGINYRVHAPNVDVTLERDVDFGVIPKTKKPSLFKSGAEKIALAYGLLQHYTVDHAIEDFTSDNPLCFYRVRCDLKKIAPNGEPYIIATGYASANTREARNGRNDIYNAANSTLKMAAKRALVAAALSVSSLSNMFSQDMENEDYVEGGTRDLSQTNDPEAPLTRMQMKVIYADAARMGMTAAQAKKHLATAGYPAMKDIKQKDYNAVRALFGSQVEGTDGNS